MNEATLNSLAASFQNGDLDCFRRIVEMLTRDLIARAHSYIHDWESARDLVQDTWLSVYESIGMYDRKRPFKAWLYTIHRNRCLDYIRKASTRMEVVGFDEAAGIPVNESGRSNAEDRTEESEYMARIREAFNCLPEKQRRVFALVDMEGESPGEAAEFLNMKPATLRSTLHFARRRMAQILSSLEVMP